MDVQMQGEKKIFEITVFHYNVYAGGVLFCADCSYLKLPYLADSCAYKVKKSHI